MQQRKEKRPSGKKIELDLNYSFDVLHLETRTEVVVVHRL